MNKHLKKVLSITFVFILAFVLIACNNGAASADKEAVEAAKLDVTMGKIIGTNASKDEIKEDLVLPLKSGDVVVSWSSDNKDVITDAGKVVRPEEEDVTVTLTASFKLNDAELVNPYHTPAGYHKLGFLVPVPYPEHIHESG